MLHIPSLRHHPIEPIAHPGPQRPHGEPKSIPAILIRVDLIVPPVTRVMSHHGPPSEREGAQRHNGDQMHTVAHGEHAHDAAQIAPQHHFAQVADVGFALVGLELFAQAFHVQGEGVVIVGGDPFVVRGQFGRDGIGVGGTTHGLFYSEIYEQRLGVVREESLRLLAVVCVIKRLALCRADPYIGLTFNATKAMKRKCKNEPVSGDVVG